MGIVPQFISCFIQRLIIICCLGKFTTTVTLKLGGLGSGAQGATTGGKYRGNGNSDFNTGPNFKTEEPKYALVNYTDENSRE